MKACENCGRETRHYPCDWCGHSEGHLEMEDVMCDFDIAEELIKFLKGVWHKFDSVPPIDDMQVVRAALDELLDHADRSGWAVSDGKHRIYEPVFLKEKEDD